MTLIDHHRLGLLRVSRAGVWYEPPICWPKWLHVATCTYCHGLRRAIRQMTREHQRSAAA